LRKYSELEKLLHLLVRLKGSDLHLKSQHPPIVRTGGKLRAVEMPEVSAQGMETLAREILDEDKLAELERTGGADIALSIPEVGRFRLNVYRQRGSLTIAARRVNTEIPSLEELHLPGFLRTLAEFERGMVILSGTTGSGKSTTLAAMIEHINRTRREHIITIEDPIEYLFTDKKSVIAQREIGIDVDNFDSALKYVVRQDPDTILIGEMRDRDTIQAAMTAAETGHLVFGTLHSGTVVQVFGRILDLFESVDHPQIRNGLAFNLQAIVCQQLLTSTQPGTERVPALEILIATPIVRKLIRDGDFAKLLDVVSSSAEEGMMDFNFSLAGLVRDGFIDKNTALAASPMREALEMHLKGIDISKKGIVS